MIYESPSEDSPQNQQSRRNTKKMTFRKTDIAEAVVINKIEFLLKQGLLAILGI